MPPKRGRPESDAEDEEDDEQEVEEEPTLQKTGGAVTLTSYPATVFKLAHAESRAIWYASGELEWTGGDFTVCSMECAVSTSVRGAGAWFVPLAVSMLHMLVAGGGVDETLELRGITMVLADDSKVKGANQPGSGSPSKRKAAKANKSAPRPPAITFEATMTTVAVKQIRIVRTLSSAEKAAIDRHVDGAPALHGEMCMALPGMPTYDTLPEKTREVVSHAINRTGQVLSRFYSSWAEETALRNIGGYRSSAARQTTEYKKLVGDGGLKLVCGAQLSFAADPEGEWEEDELEEYRATRAARSRRSSTTSCPFPCCSGSTGRSCELYSVFEEARRGGCRLSFARRLVTGLTDASRVGNRRDVATNEYCTTVSSCLGR